MNLLIDGHNLIGSNLFGDIRLSDEDDEAKLVMRLKIWQSRVRGSITVIFDRGIPGGLDVRMGNSGVQVVFAANPAQADDLIRRRLQKAKAGLVLVTNDEALLHEAMVHRVKTWRGAEFVERMKLKMPNRAEAGTEEDVQVSKAEVEEWLAIFRTHAEMKKLLRMRKKAEDAAAAAAKPPAKPAARPAVRPKGMPVSKPPTKPSKKPVRNGGGAVPEKPPENLSPPTPAKPSAPPAKTTPKSVGKARKPSGKGYKKK